MKKHTPKTDCRYHATVIQESVQKEYKICEELSKRRHISTRTHELFAGTGSGFVGTAGFHHLFGGWHLQKDPAARQRVAESFKMRHNPLAWVAKATLKSHALEKCEMCVAHNNYHTLLTSAVCKRFLLVHAINKNTRSKRRRSPDVTKSSRIKPECAIRPSKSPCATEMNCRG